MCKFENLKIVACCLLVVFFVSSCKHEKTNTLSPQVVVTTDTIAKQSSLSEVCDADFDLFFKKFSNDSIYQQEHIKFPLKSKFPDENYEDTQTEYVNKKEYKYHHFPNNEVSSKFDSSAFNTNTVKKKHIVIIKRRGIDNGIFVDFKFAFIKGCWYMIEIDDQST